MAPRSRIVDYEELRQKKVEENMRKLAELKLRHLASSVEQSFVPRPSPARVVKRKAPAAAPAVPAVKRRSGRIASLPEPATYREPAPEIVKRPRRTSKTRDLSGRVYASDEARAYAIEKATELEAELGDAYPSFVKPMLQSHTTGGFWLGLPMQFCTRYLPKKDSEIVLIDEDGHRQPTNYLAQKRGLSARWRSFAIDHNLADGDALVFQLIKPTTFQVYIIRHRDYYSS